MNQGVVVGHAQGHLVGQSADPRRLGAGQFAGRMGQHGAIPVQGRPVAGEHDLHLRLLGQGTRRLPKGALEDLDGAFLTGHGAMS